MKEQAMTYRETGVNYDLMDPYKRLAQQAAAETSFNINRFGFKVLEWTRGESVFLIETPLGYLGFVIEGLGTKNLAADATAELAHKVERLIGKTFYNNVGICNAAMAFNDMITLGVMPLVYGQYVAVGSADWFKNEQRNRDLIAGTKKACMLAGCVWGCGETPALKGIVEALASDLAGGTFGIITPKERLMNPANIQDGDKIILLESSGIHANGLTLARRIADKLPKGYLTELRDGQTYGEALLAPTNIYVGLVNECLERGIRLRYGVNITGHGWRKLMRAMQPFTYVIEKVPAPLPVFECIQENGPVTDEEAYGNLNMGAGFALFVAPEDEGAVLEIIEQCKPVFGFGGFTGGYIEKSEKRRVIIYPKNLDFAAETLAVR